MAFNISCYSNINVGISLFTVIVKDLNLASEISTSLYGSPV